MRLLAGLVLPLIVQIMLFIAVFVAASGGGSFMGLLALPVAPTALLALLLWGWIASRSTRPLGGVMLASLGIAVVPPLHLLLFRAIER